MAKDSGCDRKQIDIVSQRGDESEIELIITLEQKWATGNMRSTLLYVQDKVNICLEYINGGQIRENTKNSERVPIAIRLYSKYEIPEIAVPALQKIKEQVDAFGYEFSYEHYIPFSDRNGA